MKTPKKYVDNLKNNIVTREMLAQVIYSYNKRAKNYRDKEREYRNKYRNNRYYYDKYDNEEKNREKKEEMYAQKEFLLSLIKPACIHVEKQHKNYICNTEHEYDENIATVIGCGSYWDRDMREEVEFIKIEVDAEINCYYLFYDFGDYSFHSPIEKDELDDGLINYVDVEELKEEYKLDIIEIDNLATEGKEINDLLSVQFCRKVVEKLKDKTAKLILD